MDTLTEADGYLMYGAAEQDQLAINHARKLYTMTQAFTNSPDLARRAGRSALIADVFKADLLVARPGDIIFDTDKPKAIEALL